MIKIKRTPPPAFLLDKKKKWLKEIDKAIAHYAGNPSESFEFKHYRDKQVKLALEKIFSKCAYCESIYQASSDGDIEHFRPKGAIAEIKRKPGYYWLANDWENLLLSCQHCNQQRKHKIYGLDKPLTQGKKDQFPLKNERSRMNGPGDSFAKEEKARLLINPCIEDPEDHFTYHKELPVMIPKTDMAKESIRIYALTRHKLIVERSKVRIHLFQQMQQVKLGLENWNQNPEDPKLKKAYSLANDILLGFAAPNKPYAGMCRFYIRQFLKENQLI